ncbi:DUF4395 domain-containing protein [soil metagenome]
MYVDTRGLRFAAWLTTAVLAMVLITGNGWLLAGQAAVFAAGAFAGMRYSPYGVAFRVLIASRLRPATELEPAAPPRFAQAVGFGFAAIGVAGYLSGLTALGATATALALAAAFLNAAFGFCLGCEAYLLWRRLTSFRLRTPSTSTPSTSTPSTATPSTEGASA